MTGDVVGPAWLIFAMLVVLLVRTVFGAIRLVRFGLNLRRRREPARLPARFRVRKRDSTGSQRRRGQAEGQEKVVRPSYKGRRRFEPTEVGFYLGKDIRSRQKLYASAEDVFRTCRRAPPR